MNKIFWSRKVLMLILILTSITFIAVFYSSLIVYHASVKEIKVSLLDDVEQEKSLIQIMYNKGFAKDSILDILKASIPTSRSIGLTGEFVIADTEHGTIHFINWKNSKGDVPLLKVGKIKSKLAGPMRLAIQGKQGTLKGTDYRGIKVFAGYTYFEPYKWGIVSKISVKEVRHPFVISITFTFIMALLIILFGVYLIFRITNPMIESIVKSQENLAITLNSIGDAVITTDKSGIVTGMNPVAEKLCGWNEKEVQGKPLIEVFNIINAVTREKVTNPVSKVIEKGLVIGLANHTVLISKEGKEYQIADSAAPIKDSKGNISGVVMVFSDVTEKYATEEAHIASELRYRRLFEAARDGILILDAETGMIVDVNPYLAELLGYPYENFIKKHIWEIGFFNNIIANKANFLELQQRRGYVRYEDLPLEASDGRKKHVEFVSNVYLVDDKKVIQCNIRDITERKKAEEILSETLTELKASRLAAMSMMEDAVESKNALESANRELKLFSRVLEHLNRHNEWQNLIKDILNEIKTFTGFDAIGIRLKEGEDYPYYEQNGFTDSFVKQEKYLCSKDKEGNNIKDENGFPVHECTCGLVLSGKVDTTKPYATPGGSICTNQSTDFLALTPENEPRTNPRNTCILSGYMSVGLVPIKAGGEVIGLLQLNDKQPGRFTPEYITFFEKIASAIGIAYSRTKSEERMKASEIQLSNAVNMAKLSPWVCDVLTDTFTFNDYFYAIFHTTVEREGGYTMSSGEYTRRFVHPDDLPMVGIETKKTIETTDPNFSTQIEHRIIYADGGMGYISVRVCVVKDEQGRTIKTYGVNQDITKLKQREEEIIKLNEELEQKVKDRTAKLETANKELESFAYTVSHDLRTPLRHIEGFIDILCKELPKDLSADALNHFNVISNSSKEMGVLIDELLAFSRMSRADIVKSNFSTEALVQEVIKGFESEIQNRDVKWKIGHLPEIKGDFFIIKQAWVNLISNAIKYTSKNKTAIIEIDSYKNSANENVFFIKDNGVGFDKKYADKLFAIFQRLHLDEDFPGIGIGLANVHKIIEKHGGRIWAEGEVGKGATFYFTLP